MISIKIASSIVTFLIVLTIVRDLRKALFAASLCAFSYIFGSGFMAFFALWAAAEAPPKPKPPVEKRPNCYDTADGHALLDKWEREEATKGKKQEPEVRKAIPVK